MIYTDICQVCGHEEDDFRKVADREKTITTPCSTCSEVNWKTKEFYLPQRCWGLKGENENFPLQSHMKDNSGNRIVFESKKSYETYLSDRGMAIAGSSSIGTPPDLKVEPTERLKSSKLFKKVQDMKFETESKFIPNEEVENEL